MSENNGGGTSPEKAGSEAQASAGAGKSSGAGVDQEKVSGWKAGARVALRRFIYVAVVVLLWNGISYFELLSKNHLIMGALILAALLFILAVPVSVFLRLDQWVSEWAYQGRYELTLFVVLIAVLVNFVFLGSVIGWMRSKGRDARESLK